MDRIERWLEINTFKCPHGLGRISPEQCEANRNRPDPKRAWLYGEPPKPLQCIKCKEWKELIKKVERRREMAQKAKCKVCGEERTIKARGLCSRCYNNLFKDKKSDEIPPAKNDSQEYKVELDFRVLPFLLEELKRRAEEEIRDIGSQILWELKKAIEVNPDCEKPGGTI